MTTSAVVLAAVGCAAPVADQPPMETDAQTSTSTGSGSETGSDTQFSASISDSAPLSTTGPDGSSEGSASTGSGAIDCSEIEAESRHCLTIDGSNVHLVGLDSGRVCGLAGLEQEIHSSSLVRDDTWVIGCDEVDHALLRAELGSGDAGPHDASCQALAQHPEGLLVLPSTSGSPELYATFDAIVSGTPLETFTLEPSAARIALDGDLLYTAWHDTQAVQVWELSTSTYLMDIVLQDYDGEIFGLAAVDDRILVLGPPRDKFLRAYDAGSGALLDEIELLDLVAPQGLACR